MAWKDYYLVKNYQELLNKNKMAQTLELEVGKRYGISDWVSNYEFLGFVDFEEKRLITNFGSRGALIKIGDAKYVVAPDERGRCVVLAHYNPKTMKEADIFLGE